MPRSTSTVPSLVLLCFGVAACGHGAGEPAEPAAASSAPATAAPSETIPPAPTAAEAPSAVPEATPQASAAASAAPPASAAPEPGASAATGKPGKGKAEPAAPPAKPAPEPAPIASASAPPAADACTTTKFHYSQLGAACHSGGRKAAKEVMKGVVKKAKAAGTDLKCTSCHVDMNSFQLKGNAVADLKQWL